MKVCIVIVTHNSADVVEKCLDSLKLQKIAHNVIVVDCASQDQTQDILIQKYPQVTLIALPDNLGFAGGNNVGIEKALTQNPDCILILNPDTYFFPHQLDKLIAGAEKIGAPGIFGPIMYTDENRAAIWAAGGRLDPVRYTTILNRTLDTYTFIPGTGMLISLEVFHTGLRFDEDYFMYYEEVEFCIQAEKKGFHCYLVPESGLVHFETSSQNQVKEYYLARNHLLFIEHNAPFKVQLHEFLRSPKTLYEHIVCHNTAAVRGFFDYFFRRFGKVV